MKTALLTCKTFQRSRPLALDLPSQEQEEELERVTGSLPEIPASSSCVSPPSLCESIQLVMWSWGVLEYIVYGRLMEMGMQL